MLNAFRKERGFTLVEIAIALTVISLILGGIIVGASSVIENAKTNSLLEQIKDLAAASRDFKSRYGYYPGDLPNAGTLITTDGGVSAGCSYPAVISSISSAGNGIVNTSTESRCALEHLVKARMIGKVEMSGSNYVINHPLGGGEVSLWFTSANENAIRVTNLPCEIALRIDSKFDNASSTPLASGFVASNNAGITGCTPGGVNDPVAVLLISY